MSEILDDRKYTKSHEWVLDNGDGTVNIGISDHAQELLGDIVYVELPEMDAEFGAEDAVGVVESVKAASDIYAPVPGTVVAVNEALDDAPETVNSDPFGEGWIYTLKLDSADDLDELMDADAYQTEVADD
ncbi:MAG TPA: glycine cleavage system protein GcvH, partial [Thiothrix sp.]|nr:glycine cleavage system protein GcvH [Thiothrix sp.]